MKIPLLTTIILLPLTLAHPWSSPPSMPSLLDASNTTLSTRSDTTILPRAPYGVITLTLSTAKIGFGGTPYATLYNNIYQAIRGSCPSNSYNSQCLNRYHPVKGKFGTRIHSAPGVAPFAVDVKLTIVSAKWNGNVDLYNLMVGSLAGAIERGTYSPRNCETFLEVEGGAKKGYTFCNSAAGARIEVPGEGGEHMEISLESVRGRGDWVCEAATGTVAQYVEGLKGEFEKALGVEKASDLYVNAKCNY